MDLSIVIPAFEESKKIGRDVEAAAAFLEANRLDGQIIVVDDGSKDNTSEAAKNVEIPSSISLKVIRYEHHRGKGYAVRKGIKQTSGEYVMFADSGCCVPYENALRGLSMLKDGTCDIAHGSRKLLESHIRRGQPWRRRVCARVFKWSINKILQIPPELTDTQCGFKIYKGELARELYNECISDGFMFDVEIILRAQKQGYQIKEFPIDWTCDRDSRLSLLRTPLPVLFELRAVKRAISNTAVHLRREQVQ